MAITDATSARRKRGRKMKTGRSWNKISLVCVDFLVLFPVTFYL